MKTILTAAIILLSATQAFAEVAFWTGNLRYVTTVTGKNGVSCQFQASGGTFWMTFTSGMCPMSIDVD